MSANNDAVVPVDDPVNKGRTDCSNSNVNDKLIQAILKEDLQLVKDAINAGADVNIMVAICVPWNYHHYESTGRLDNISDIRIYCVPLFIAVLRKDIEIVRELISNGADVNLQVSGVCGPDTALQLATRTGQTNLVRLLLENHADITVMCQLNGFTPIHQAFRLRHFDIVKLMIKILVDINLIDIRDRMQMTLLHHAARKGNECIDIVRELIKHHANVNCKCKYGFTPLHCAAGNGSDEVSAALLENGARIEEKEDSGKTALHVAAERSHHTAPINILIKHGADINACDSRGCTTIHHATKMAERAYHCVNHNDILATVKLLIEYKADVTLGDKDGLTALHFLSLKDISNIENVILLCNNERVLNAQDSCGRTALQNSVSLGFHHVVEVFLSYDYVNVNTRDISGSTPLHSAIPVGHEETIMALLGAGSDIHALDRSGKSVLHLAAIYGHTRLINIFIEKELDPNETDNAGRNGLHYAVMYRQDEAVKTLLEKNANHEETDVQGMRPRDYLNPCEKTSLIFRLLCGEQVNTPVFTFNGDERFSIPVADDTPNMSEVSRIPGLGDVSEISEFNFSDFVTRIRKTIKEIISTVIPEFDNIHSLAEMRELMEISQEIPDAQVLHILQKFHSENIIGCGSSWEGSKVGIPDELDFLVQLYYLGKHYEHQEGYTNMFSDTGFIREEKNVHVEYTYGVWLWKKLTEYWYKNQNESLGEFPGKVQFLMPLPPQQYTDRTTCVTWVWLYNDDTFKMLPVSIDLHSFVPVRVVRI
jgi:ankyrin repeat protein